LPTTPNPTTPPTPPGPSTIVVLGEEDAEGVAVEAVLVLLPALAVAYCAGISGTDGLLRGLKTALVGGAFAVGTLILEGFPVFLDARGRPFSNRCSALGVLASFLTECFNRPMKPLFELELELVGEKDDNGVDGIEGEAVEDPGAVNFAPTADVGGTCADGLGPA
jgi:hypothetical protein